MRMGKSSNGRTAKKGPAKPKAKASANGHGGPRKSAAPRPSQKPQKRGSARAIVLPAGYRPLESEPFMNERHRLYFRNKLIAWKEEIVRQNRETLHVLHE